MGHTKNQTKMHLRSSYINFKSIFLNMIHMKRLFSFWKREINLLLNILTSTSLVVNFQLAVCGKIKHFFRHSWLTQYLKEGFLLNWKRAKILIEHSEISWTFSVLSVCFLPTLNGLTDLD